MKRKLARERGVSLITLSITVIIIVLITGMMIYNAKDGIYIKNLQALQNDIQNLREKVSEYYNEYGKIPASVEYANTENIANLESVLNTQEKSEESKFYVIDLKAMKGITLNYGEDYETIKDTQDITTVNSVADLYIINNLTHNIFYVQGIGVKQNDVTAMYYTDYTEPDNTYVDFRYVDGVKIPEGFYYVGGNKNEGIVISDVKQDDLSNSKGGNQFVWVPVENFYEFEREDFGNQGIGKNNFIATGPTDSKYYEEEGDGSAFGTETEKMYQSVKIYKGFYIGRFEAGIEADTERTSSSTIEDDVVVKKDKYVYNFINWSDSNDVETGGAVEKAKSMYQDEEIYEVTSTLCYGVQWDAVMRWINQDEGLSNIITDSSLVGNYSGTLEKTGSSDEYKIKNIYDMAGNVAEWTNEVYSTDYRDSRGGSYDDSGSSYPISYRASGSPTNSLSDIGFRVSLYLNVDKNQWSETYTETKKYTDINGDVAYIPKGFQVSLSPAMNEIQNGLVIRDGTGDATTDGSEFVWVPVEDSSKFVRADWDSWSGDLDESPPVLSSDYRENETTYEYIQMKNSVMTYGGFYVARYEAGINGTTDTTTTNDTNKQTQDGSVKPVSKANVGVWNFISWGGTSTAEATDGYQGNDTADGAVKVARSMYPDIDKITEYALPETATNDTGVKSTLIYGVQWDAIMEWMKGIENNSATKEFPQNKYILDATGKGAYEMTSPKMTALKDSYAVKNIYDMAGNLIEWTNEADSGSSRVYRGGSYSYLGSKVATAFRRTYKNPEYNGDNVGFRVALYL